MSSDWGAAPPKRRLVVASPSCSDVTSSPLLPVGELWATAHHLLESYGGRAQHVPCAAERLQGRDRATDQRTPGHEAQILRAAASRAAYDRCIPHRKVHRGRPGYGYERRAGRLLFLFVSGRLCLPVCPSVCLSVFLSICMSICLSICLPKISTCPYSSSVV